MISSLRHSTGVEEVIQDAPVQRDTEGRDNHGPCDAPAKDSAGGGNICDDRVEVSKEKEGGQKEDTEA